MYYFRYGSSFSIRRYFVLSSLPFTILQHILQVWVCTVTSFKILLVVSCGIVDTLVVFFADLIMQYRKVIAVFITIGAKGKLLVDEFLAHNQTETISLQQCIYLALQVNCVLPA